MSEQNLGETRGGQSAALPSPAIGSDIGRTSKSTSLATHHVNLGYPASFLPLCIPRKGRVQASSYRKPISHGHGAHFISTITYFNINALPKRTRIALFSNGIVSLPVVLLTEAHGIK